RTCAMLVYSLCGVGGYAVAVGLGLVAVRLLSGREPVARGSVVLGASPAVTSIGTLLPLVASGDRVGTARPGGAPGEGSAEGPRPLVSTAGTALLALVGLVVAAVIASPLRIGQVLEAIGGACRWVGLGAVRGARRVGEDVAGFSGEVIRA